MLFSPLALFPWPLPTPSLLREGTGVLHSLLPAHPQSDPPPQCPHSDAALVNVGRVALRPLLGSKELMGAWRVVGSPAVGRARTGIQRAAGPKSC